MLECISIVFLSGGIVYAFMHSFVEQQNGYLIVFLLLSIGFGSTIIALQEEHNETLYKLHRDGKIPTFKDMKPYRHWLIEHPKEMLNKQSKEKEKRCQTKKLKQNLLDG